MRTVLNILILCLFAAPQARAGAWLREQDTAFFSVSATVRYTNKTWRSENNFYGEYGVTPRLTLGLDINEMAGIAGHALVFARLPIGPADRRTKLAVELGIGKHHVRGQWGTMLKSTLSVGRGFSSRWGNGWFNVDAALEQRRPAPDPAFKLDGAIGLSNGRRIRPFLQLESTFISGQSPIWSLTPGVLIDGRNNTTWQIGLERRTAGQSSLGLKFGLWRRF